jgi:hypothetical protein
MLKCSSGFGMVLAAQASKATTAAELVADLVAAKKTLDESRPTAVNLMYAGIPLSPLPQQKIDASCMAPMCWIVDWLDGCCRWATARILSLAQEILARVPDMAVDTVREKLLEEAQVSH